MQARPLNGPFGIEFLDIDVNQLTDAQLACIQSAQNEHGVVFIRNQVLTPEQHIDFANRWGEIVINRFFPKTESDDRIAVVSKTPQQQQVVGEQWHTDHSYDQAPAMGSILYAKTVPTQGGNTNFASMYLAYEALSNGLKATLEGMNAIHSSRHVFGDKAQSLDPDNRFLNAELATQDSIHPVIISHPKSGKKALYVNPDFTIGFEGWTAEESAPLLNYLFDHGQRSEFVVSYRWQKGDIAFWDNRATWHRANNDYPTESRLMHRITLAGEPLHR